MTVETDLCAVLETVVTQAFPDVAPVDTPMPYATYQQIGGETVNYTDGALPSLKNGLFQVSVWGESRIQVAAAALQIEAALIDAAPFQAQPVAAPAADYDEDMERYGSRQDFSIWSNR